MLLVPITRDLGVPCNGVSFRQALLKPVVVYLGNLHFWTQTKTTWGTFFAVYSQIRV